MYRRSQLEKLARVSYTIQEGIRLSSVRNEAALDSKLTSASPDATVFCSHSHKDSELVIGLKFILAELGISLYVDWDDPDLPGYTSGATAELIREKIEEHKRFIVVVTDNSKTSYWVPWELGLADNAKRWKDIALLPVKEGAKNFRENEYMELYQTIEPDEDDKPRIFAPGSVTSKVTLKQWLLR